MICSARSVVSCVGTVCLLLALAGCSSRGGGGGLGTGGDNDFPDLIGGGDGGAGNGNTNGGGNGNNNGGGGETVICNKMDILFVIDNSGSMGEEQANLASNFPKFIEVLNDFRAENGEALDYRIGITTTSVSASLQQPAIIPGFPPTTVPITGDDGRLLQAASCGMKGKWISSTDGDVANTFACAAKVGTEGSGIEMHFKAVDLALTDRVGDGSNAGFLRDDALLAVVMLSDEDDCSHVQDPISFDPLSTATCPAGQLIGGAELASTLDQVKGDRSRWAAAVIAGPAGANKCSSDFGDADPGNRLESFITVVGKNGIMSSICDGDLSAGLLDAVSTFDEACQAFVPVL